MFTYRTESVIVRHKRKLIIPPIKTKKQTKGRSIMGDRSPKSINKQSSQKQVKADQFKKAKQQAAFAKQSIGKKK